MTTILVILVVLSTVISLVAIIPESYALHLLAGWLCFITALCVGTLPQPHEVSAIAMTLLGTANLVQAYRYGGK